MVTLSPAAHNHLVLNYSDAQYKKLNIFKDTHQINTHRITVRKRVDGSRDLILIDHRLLSDQQNEYRLIWDEDNKSWYTWRRFGTR